MIVACDELFDGEGFRGPSVLELDDGLVTAVTPRDGADVSPDAQTACLVLPALVDASVRCRGYRESALEPPFAASAHILSLHHRYGIRAFKESGNSWEALRYLVDVLGCDDAVLSGPVLVSGDPAHEVERPVIGEDGARRAVASAHLEGATWLMLGSALEPDEARSTLAEARRLGLLVAARPGCCSIGLLAAEGARAVHGAHLLLMGRRHTRDVAAPSDLAQRWAEVSPMRSPTRSAAS